MINPDWQDMFVLLISGDNSHEQGFYCVYRNPQEGAILQQERKITAHIEADHQHVAAVVNLACSWIWCDIISNAPTIHSPTATTKLKTNG